MMGKQTTKKKLEQINAEETQKLEPQRHFQYLRASQSLPFRTTTQENTSSALYADLHITIFRSAHRETSRKCQSRERCYNDNYCF